MAHNVETMAYAGEVPWHGLGEPVSNDLTPEQMMEKSGTNWTVHLRSLGADLKQPDGKRVTGTTSDKGLFRQFADGTWDTKALTTTSGKWNPIQNAEAFEFFNDFVGAGHMEMHTAGSLQDGRMVWVLAKVKEAFEVGKGDVVESYLLFTNFHIYGKSDDIRFTGTRVVCNNTLNVALSEKGEQIVKVSHRTKFDAEQVKETLGLAHIKMEGYAEMAKFLAKKKFDKESVAQYFAQVFPITTIKEQAGISRNAKEALELVDFTAAEEKKRGVSGIAGTWWNAFNTVTYMTDHTLGNSQDSRLRSAWYGPNRKLKVDALKLALDFADA